MTDDVETIPLFPLNTVLLPGVALPLHIFEPRYKTLIADCLQRDPRFGVVLIAEGQEVGGPARPYAVGTTARIVSVDQLDNGRMNIVTLGERRFRILDAVGGKPYLQARVRYWPDEPDTCDLVALAAQARQALQDLLAAGRAEPDLAVEQLPSEPAQLCNVIASGLPVDPATRQALLEEPSLCARLLRAVQTLSGEAEMLRATGAVRFIASRPSTFSPN
jgi:Lon protease-like protein